MCMLTNVSSDDDHNNEIHYKLPFPMPAMPAEPSLAEKNDSAPVCFLKSSPVYISFPSSFLPSRTIQIYFKKKKGENSEKYFLEFTNLPLNVILWQSILSVISEASYG